MSARKSLITVDAKRVTDRYANERVINFSSPVGGGLISFTITPDDQLSVHVYRHDMTVKVTAGEADTPVRHGNLRADAALYRAAKAFAADYESRNTTPARVAGNTCLTCSETFRGDIIGQHIIRVHGGMTQPDDGRAS